MPSPAASSLDIFVVSHTHWDREWYLPAGRFRQRLVALVDELLGGAATPEKPFLLDGQAVLIDDYLAVRPDARERLGELLRDRSLEAGPWYVLADELIPSGEALVRNLLAGRAVLRSLGAESPRVLYCPDSFGHPAALPVLAEGFSLPLIVLWRGYGGAAWPAGDTFRWRAAGGATALVYHLACDGYELGSSLPDEPRAAEARWEAIRDALAPRAAVGVVLLPNGADHHALQPRLERALEALARAAAPAARIQSASLARFAAALDAAARETELPVVGDGSSGVELRDSYGYTWTLQGTFASRAALKRRNAHAERLLVRDVEPWVALCSARDRSGRASALLHAAWKTLLLCHPHDTICGCSIDEVARAMAARLEDATSQGRGLRDDALLGIVGHDPAFARLSPAAWRPVVVVRNAAARTRGGMAELEILRLREHVRVGPGSAPAPRAATSTITSSDSEAAPLPPFSIAEGRVIFQSLDRSVRHDRIESPTAYPYDDLVESERVVAWVPPVAGYGTHSFTIDDPSDDPSRARRTAGQTLVLPVNVSVTERSLDNGELRVMMDDAGAIRMESRELDVAFEALMGFEDVGDVGDLYTHSPCAPCITDARFAGARLHHAGPLRGELHATWTIAIPEFSVRSGRSARTRDTTLHAAFTLDAGAPFLRVRVWGTNECRDHRLRVVFRSAISGAELWADAAFGPVRRSQVVARDTHAETPPPTAPLHRYVTLAGAKHGLTLYSDGMAEYEATRAGDIAVTLVRAVGELSRNDVPERPGHAGWPVDTPEAQSLGAFEARFALLPHRARGDATIALVERTADDVLLPLRGTTLRSALATPAPTSGVQLVLDDAPEELAGAIAFSACKPAEDGNGIVLRCVNLTDRPLRARWRLGIPVSAALLARLDETPIEDLALEGRDIPFRARPHAVTSIIAR